MVRDVLKLARFDNVRSAALLARSMPKLSMPTAPAPVSLKLMPAVLAKSAACKTCSKPVVCKVMSTLEANGPPLAPVNCKNLPSASSWNPLSDPRSMVTSSMPEMATASTPNFCRSLRLVDRCVPVVSGVASKVIWLVADTLMASMPTCPEPKSMSTPKLAACSWSICKLLAEPF